MKLYYTTSQGSEQTQDKPTLSLGGYKSSSPVPNSKFGNLFGEISQMTISSYNQNSYIGLILKNELPGAANNVKLWFDYSANCYSKLRVSFVQLSTDSEGQLYMERVSDKFSKPLMIVTDFVEADGEANQVDVSSFPIGTQIGVWVERELLMDVIRQDNSECYELVPGYTDRYQAKDVGNQDDIKLNLSWD